MKSARGGRASARVGLPASALMEGYCQGRISTQADSDPNAAPPMINARLMTFWPASAARVRGG
jgi:hypothetical protein